MAKTTLIQIAISACFLVGFPALVPERLLHLGPWLGFAGRRKPAAPTYRRSWIRRRRGTE